MGRREHLRALVVFLERLCSVERLGGRTRAVDDRTLELHDVMSWPHGATEYVQGHFPDVVVHIRSCRRSLSGFVVVFVRRCGGRGDLLLYVAVSVALGCCVYLLRASPWWVGAYGWIQAI